MIDSNFYEMIFKRKSFHLFKDIGNGHISNDELNDIYKAFNLLDHLVDGIKVDIKIVKEESTCTRGQEYSILMYSEIKDNYLQNIGYIGEQLDLYLVSKNIGTLWFGIGKTNINKYNGLDYVIMMAIAKVDNVSKFRKDMFKSKRKSVDEMWIGDSYLNIANIVRFAPSACNTQPWIVESINNSLYVYRYKKDGKRGIMPKDKVIYYNQIDIGIFLCFMELCLNHENLKYDKTLYIEKDIELEKNLSATYNIF